MIGRLYRWLTMPPVTRSQALRAILASPDAPELRHTPETVAQVVALGRPAPAVGESRRAMGRRPGFGEADRAVTQGRPSIRR
ncbi:MAG: hypothetical protein ABI652_04025, partial [Acidobacteriota bacterium]